MPMSRPGTDYVLIGASAFIKINMIEVIFVYLIEMITGRGR